MHPTETNYRMCKHAARYVYFVITNAPRFIFAMAKHVYLPRVRATVIGRTVELYRVIRAFARGEHRLPGIDKTPGCRTQSVPSHCHGHADDAVYFWLTVAG